MYNAFNSDIDYSDCLWSLPILSYSDGPHFSGMDKATDTLIKWGNLLGGDGPSDLVKTPREQGKDDQPNSEQVWEVVRDSNFCAIFDSSIYTWLTGWFFPILKHIFGWGEIEADDQIVADLYGQLQLVNRSSSAWSALYQIKQAACDKKKQDSYTEIDKTLTDILINVAIFWATGGEPWIISLVTTVCDVLTSVIGSPGQHQLTFLIVCIRGCWSDFGRCLRVATVG